MKTTFFLMILAAFLFAGCRKNYSCTCDKSSSNTDFAKNVSKSEAGDKCQQIARRDSTNCAVPI